MKKQTLFTRGEGGYFGYRIPAVVTLSGNRVVVFCEGRLNGLGDAGTIHILARISTDGGESFGEPFLAASKTPDTLGNPCPVYDRDTGILHLLLCSNLCDGDEHLILQGKAPRTVHHTCSEDGGETWSPLRDLTLQTKKENWTWYATGPCHALQLQSGRLLIPCDHEVSPGEELFGSYFSHAIYSDDHGETWQIGEDVGTGVNECCMAELPDGRVYVNLRPWGDHCCRAGAWSGDGGVTWRDLYYDATLPDPCCQGSVIASGDRLYLSNAATTDKRERMTIRQSLDMGKTWSEGTVIHGEAAAYSDLTVLPDGRIGCMFECGNGQEDPLARYQRIDWAILDPEEIH